MPFSFTDFLSALKRLFTNPRYAVFVLNWCLAAFAISGMFPFVIKYLEVYFNLSTSKSNLLVGMFIEWRCWNRHQFGGNHYCDVIIGPMVSKITSLTILYSTVHSGADQRKHQSSASLAFVQGIHRWPVNSPHIWPVTRFFFSIFWRHHGMLAWAWSFTNPAD